MNAVAEVFDLFARGGSVTYDEAVTLEEHSLQTAALALHAEAPDHLVVAALLHDIGHVLESDARGNHDYTSTEWCHDAVAAEWLRPRFGDAVADAVAGHVDAKRWLCATDPGYHDTLSAASKASLIAQGGVFSDTEADAWGSLPGADDAVRLRRWDDDGKVAGLRIPPLDHYRPLLGSSLNK